MEITTIAVDPDQKLLYVGLYESGSAKELKGGLYIYDADSGELLETYDNIADRPVRVIYKERVQRKCLCEMIHENRVKANRAFTRFMT